jgi:predicted outer membrane protein
MTKHIFAALAIAALTASTIQAQQATTQNPAQPGQSAANANAGAYASPQGAAAAGQLDQAIATCLALGNHEEVALAKFAQGRAESDQVKQFAEMMVRDHQAALEKLNRLSPQLATLNLNLEEGAHAAAAPTTTAQAGHAGAGGDVSQQMVAMQRSVAQHCLQLTQRELGEKNGAEFDRCYIGQQVGAHVAMLAKLKGSEQFATGELRNFIQEATKTVESHHKHAKELAKSLMDQSGEHAAQREDAARR